MRFAAVVVRPKQPAPVPAPQQLRQSAPPPVAPRPQEVPPDLDQRVRLVGEW